MIATISRLLKKLKRRRGLSNFMVPEGSMPSTSNWVSYNTLSDPLSFASNMTVREARVFDIAGTAVKDLPDLRVEKKPVEIVSEIVAPEPVLALTDLKRQITIVETRLKILRRFGGNIGDETMALRYLNARTKYAKYKKLFPWAITTEALVSELVKKYKVSVRGFGGYSRNVPIEATNELEKFGKAWEKVVDDDTLQPALQLITDYDGTETKKDPILLASSPFGKWWYILGAWDKEVEIVDEIIYKGK